MTLVHEWLGNSLETTDNNVYSSLVVNLNVWSSMWSPTRGIGPQTFHFIFVKNIAVSFVYRWYAFLFWRWIKVRTVLVIFTWEDSAWAVLFTSANWMVMTRTSVHHIWNQNVTKVVGLSLVSKSIQINSDQTTPTQSRWSRLADLWLINS